MESRRRAGCPPDDRRHVQRRERAKGYSRPRNPARSCPRRPARGRFRHPRRSTGTSREIRRPLRVGTFVCTVQRASCRCIVLAARGTKHGHGAPCTLHRARRYVQYAMTYPEHFVEPMRLELTQLGVDELRTAADVDAAVRKTPGTLLIVVNSVCRCAAGKARPGVALALRHQTRP